MTGLRVEFKTSYEKIGSRRIFFGVQDFPKVNFFGGKKGALGQIPRKKGA